MATKKISEKQLARMQEKAGVKLTTVKKAQDLDDLAKRLTQRIDQLDASHSKNAKSLAEDVLQTSMDHEKLLVTILQELKQFRALIGKPVETVNNKAYDFKITRDGQGLIQSVTATPK